jgi:hypothetical protein
VTDLDYIRSMAGRDHGLAVAAGAASRRLDRLRVGHPITVTFRAGWTWTSVEGCAEIVGPDDPHPHLDGDALSKLLRAIFTGERTTTGPPTTKPWRTSDDRQSSSGLDASTPILLLHKQ